MMFGKMQGGGGGGSQNFANFADCSRWVLARGWGSGSDPYELP